MMEELRSAKIVELISEKTQSGALNWKQSVSDQLEALIDGTRYILTKYTVREERRPDSAYDLLQNFGTHHFPFAYATHYKLVIQNQAMDTSHRITIDSQVLTKLEEELEDLWDLCMDSIFAPRDGATIVLKQLESL